MIGPAVVRGIVVCLAAVLIAPAAARAEDAAAVPRAERHSPRQGYPSVGPEGARNTLIFFTDYQCPVCPRAARELDRLVADLNGALRIELHHNPLVMHRFAYDAASAAKAAQWQGKFWEYHELLLKSTRFDRDSLIALAGTAGLDRQKFQRDFDNQELRKQVTAEVKQALDANALGTPGFLINGHVEVGWASTEWLEQVIRQNLR